MAQNPAEEFQYYITTYPEKLAVRTINKEVVRITINESGKLDVKLTKQLETILLDDKATLARESGAAYTDIMQLDNIEAYALIPGAKKYKMEEVTSFKTKNSLGNEIFHDDVVEKTFVYPPLVKGAKTHLKIDYNLADPFLLSPFRFTQRIPVNEAAFEVICDKNIEIGYQLFNVDSINLNFTVTEEKNLKKYSWTANKLKEIAEEENILGGYYNDAHIVMYIKNYTHQNKKKDILGSVSLLHDYYNSLIDTLNKNHYKPLQLLADSLCKGLNSDTDKAKAIYHWVQSNIKYIAFESGYEGFVPKEAKQVYETRYADCKGMSSILVYMLQQVNVPAYLVWIGTRSLPYTYNNNPTCSNDNHMIAAVKINDEFIFIDGTSQQTKFGMPSSFTQNKEALISFSKKDFVVQKVPIPTPQDNQYKDSLYLEIDNNLIVKGQGFSTYKGYTRENMIYRLNDNTYDDNLKMLKQYFQKGNNKFILDSYKVENKAQKDLPLKIDYNFNIQNYLVQLDDELYFNMNLDKIYNEEIISKDRKYDYDMGYKKEYCFISTLKIPDGYELSFLPKNASFNNELFQFDMKYQLTGVGHIEYKTIVIINALAITKKDFNIWFEYVNALKKNYAQSIVLKKKK